MFVLTTKVDIKKVLIVVAVAAALLIGLLILPGGEDTPTAGISDSTVATNDDRVKFLADFGWEVKTTPTESSQVRIPKETTEVFDRYNMLQKSQGYDLTPFGGKNVMRYVYEVENYPNATEPVYATLLVYKNQVIGGDITNTAAKGSVQGFRKTAAATPQPTAPTA